VAVGEGVLATVRLPGGGSTANLLTASDVDGSVRGAGSDCSPSISAKERTFDCIFGEGVARKKVGGGVLQGALLCAANTMAAVAADAAATTAAEAWKEPGEFGMKVGETDGTSSHSPGGGLKALKGLGGGLKALAGSFRSSMQSSSDRCRRAGVTGDSGVD